MTSAIPSHAVTHAPLEILATQAFRQYGEMAAGSTIGSDILMILELANRVIDEINVHPYWQIAKVEHYQHQTETRPIPDQAVRAGILAFYAERDGNEKTPILLRNFYRTLNQSLLFLYNQGARPELAAFDRR